MTSSPRSFLLQRHRPHPLHLDLHPFSNILPTPARVWARSALLARPTLTLAPLYPCQPLRTLSPSRRRGCKVLQSHLPGAPWVPVPISSQRRVPQRRAINRDCSRNCWNMKTIPCTGMNTPHRHPHRRPRHYPRPHPPFPREAGLRSHRNRNRSQAVTRQPVYLAP